MTGLYFSILLLLHLVHRIPAIAIPQRARAAIDACYPPTSYGTRRDLARDAAVDSAISFTPEGIPLAGDSMVYGEFDLSFFADLLDIADPQPGETFLDIGSGAGRLVLAAALHRPNTWANCHGIELSSPLHDAAIAARYAFENLDEPLPPIAPCQYTLSDCMEGPGIDAMGTADVAFSYAVTWANDETHSKLVRKIAKELPSGARVISIDLPFSEDIVASEGARLDLVGSMVGYNEETGKETVGFVYKLLRH